MKRIFRGFCLFVTMSLAITVLSACNDKQNKVSSFNFEDIIINHKYENGELATTVGIPSEYKDISIHMNMNMPGMDHEIKDVSLKKEEQIYTANVDVPMDGIWDINYTFEKDGKTYFNSFTEIFGSVAEDQKKDYTASLFVNPEPILPHQDTKFEIRLTDKEVNVIENAEITLDFHIEDKNINKIMEFRNGLYYINVTFDEIGNYHLTILINNKNRDKIYEEKLEIPVGITPGNEQEEHEAQDHGSHH